MIQLSIRSNFHKFRELTLFLLTIFVIQFVYSAPNPGQAAAAAASIAVFTGVSAISFAAFPLSKTFSIALLQALSCGAIGAIIVRQMIQKQLGKLLSSEAENIASTKKSSIQHVGLLSEVAGPTGAQLQIVFGYMQVLSACFMSFAHGGNDVSNVIGPQAAALSILQGVAGSAEIVIPTEVLVWGGFGIVAGLTMWGYRVIATIGKKITELTPTRGFAAEFAAASVVLFASKLGLPISATHTLVGAVMGVGFARGLNRVRQETVLEIVASWMVTIPVGAVLSIFYTLISTKLLTFFM
jgi:solute carrier family 20 (sodium-dependent phosphate transporter)